jgi:hypothetical protein
MNACVGKECNGARTEASVIYPGAATRETYVQSGVQARSGAGCDALRNIMQEEEGASSQFYLPPSSQPHLSGVAGGPEAGHRRSGGRAPPIGSSALRCCAEAPQSGAFGSVLDVTRSEKKHYKRGGGLVSLTGAPWPEAPRLGTAAALCGAARKQHQFWM